MAVRFLGAASFLLLIALAGCSDQGGEDGPQVAIHGSTFDPATLTVPARTHVTWVNHDSFDHSTTSTLWDSGDLGQDESYDVEMPSEPGTYQYHCKFHPSMHGTIIVQ
jgi:plastocyanin